MRLSSEKGNTVLYCTINIHLQKEFLTTEENVKEQHPSFLISKPRLNTGRSIQPKHTPNAPELYAIFFNCEGTDEESNTVCGKIMKCSKS